MNGLEMLITLGQVTVYIPKPIDVPIIVESYTIPVSIIESNVDIEIDTDYTISVIAVMTKGV